MTPRALAAQIVLEVVAEGRSLSTCIARTSGRLKDPRDRAFARELAFGVLRWWPRLDAMAGHLLEKPLKDKDLDIHIALLIGLYQLIYMRVPPHAAVSQTVAMAQQRRKPWAAGVLNAVLRRFERESQLINERTDKDEAAAFAHPTWLIDALRAAWPGDWQGILVQNNQRPPMALRVNAVHSTRAHYMQILEQASIAASAIPHTTHGVSLARAVDVDVLPLFREGGVSVQDGASQLAAAQLGLGPGLRVLDACAAPGGKAAHMLEAEPRLGELVVLDHDPARMRRLDETMARLGLEVTAICADATEPQRWWDDKPFDRILVDAPCSATGVIRRHPDIKLHRRAEDIRALADRQREILDALWPLLVRNGRLLYATCSVLPQENDNLVRGFVDRHGDAEPLAIADTWGRSTGRGRQLLPGECGMDGFYYAVLLKH